MTRLDKQNLLPDERERVFIGLGGRAYHTDSGDLPWAGRPAMPVVSGRHVRGLTRKPDSVGRKQIKKPLTGVIATAALALAISVPGTDANAKQASEWTCQDFLAIGDEAKPRVVYWMEGLDKSGKPDLGDVVIEDFDRPISTVVEECKKEPNASLWDKIKKYFSKL